MGWVEENLLPRVHAVLKELEHPLADEVAAAAGLPTSAAEQQAVAEAAHSVAMAQQTETPVAVPVAEAKAAAEEAPPDATWADVAGKAKAAQA